MSFGALSLMQQGGPVMWVLLLLSCFGLVLAVERALYLHKGQIRTEPFLDGVKNLARKRRWVEALTVCEETPGPVAAVIKAGLLHRERDEAGLRAAMQEAALVEIPMLERRIGTIAALARIAPLLGLLGTVLGLYTAFGGLAVSDTQAYPTFGSLMGGVGQALLTTLLGIAISILGQLTHHFLHGRVRALVHDMEYCGHEMLTFLTWELAAQGPAPRAPEAKPAAPEVRP